MSTRTRFEKESKGNFGNGLFHFTPFAVNSSYARWRQGFFDNTKARLCADHSRENQEIIQDKLKMSVRNTPKIFLTEDNIDGASLRGKTPDQLTIPELKRWLSQRKGAKLNEENRGRNRYNVERFLCAYYI